MQRSVADNSSEIQSSHKSHSRRFRIRNRARNNLESHSKLDSSSMMSRNAGKRSKIRKSDNKKFQALAMQNEILINKI